MKTIIYILTVSLILILIVSFISLYPKKSGDNEIKLTEPVELKETENKIATFAGGCFWCVEAAFEKKGFYAVSGYAGGIEENPKYKEVSSGSTGHVEAVQVFYDPTKTKYKELLNIYWDLIDPTDAEGSFVDRGYQYTSAIFYHDEEQRKLAEESKEKIAELFDDPIVTRIEKFSTFYEAEEYHQDYHVKNPLKYSYYRSRSGRDQFREKTYPNGLDLFANENLETEERTYKIPTENELKKILSPLQFKVTQNDGTEPSFKNEYWNNTEPGIYVDIVSGEPLFSSIDKYKSGTGWPSFTKPLEPTNIIEKEDNTLFTKRTEIRSKYADSHLGHVFNDGPQPTGLRYCMNSAALKFIHKDDLEKEGYGEYSKLFM